MELIKKGAEAELYLVDYAGTKAISKKRIKKNYRTLLLDSMIRKRRTKSEAKILRELNGVVDVPSVFVLDENNFEIIMEYIDGVVLKKVIEKEKQLCVLAGKQIKKIHDKGIIHGDLTTSNIIYKKEKTKNNVLKKLYFIDFGLGYYSKKIEDRAVDLIVFKKTFNATHSSLKDGWEMVMKGYCPSEEMILRMEEIEKRARYH